MCRARHMFLKVSQMYRIPIHLASLRPSLMEAKGVVVWQRGTVTVLLKEAVLPRQGTTKVRDDVQESSMRRTYRDEPAQQGKVLYPLQGMSVNSAFTY